MLYRENIELRRAIDTRRRFEQAQMERYHELAVALTGQRLQPAPGSTEADPRWVARSSSQQPGPGSEVSGTDGSGTDGSGTDGSGTGGSAPASATTGADGSVGGVSGSTGGAAPASGVTPARASDVGLDNEGYSVERGLGSVGSLEVRVERGRLVIELPGEVLFAGGSARLSRAGREVVAEVAQELSRLRNRRLQVEGHTDALPIATREFPSNWELSVARAVAVVRALESGGVRPGVLSAAGFAATMPRADNDTPEGRARNRRIEIVVLPEVVEE